MPDKPSLTLVKKFTYRGQPEEFSNTYHFNGTTPADLAAWKVFADAVIAAEKLTQWSTTSWVRAYGYNAGSSHADAVIDYTISPAVVVTGTFSTAGGISVPGDIAAVIRWTTPEFTEKGKRIYLRKFMHGVNHDASSLDAVDAAQKTALQAYAVKWQDGTISGDRVICGPQGALGSGATVLPYLTTRTLKRRGKRPSPSAP